MLYRNNPLNIRYNDRNSWLGQISPKHGFCQFRTIFFGFRAAVALVKRYRSFGKTTVRQIVSRWAPPTENKTEDYINIVCSKMNVSSDYEIKSYIDYFNLLHSMTLVETGEWYSSWNDELNRAIVYEGIC